LHGPRVLEAIIPVSRWLHFVGFSLAVGSATAVTIARHKARNSTGAERSAIESLIAEVVTKVELAGLGIALLGGLLAVVLNPTVIDPQGASGPWFFVKMPMVLALFLAAFVKMVDAQRIVSERANGAKDAELAAVVARGSKLDLASIILGVAILFVTVFRFVFFA
jgi:hypothetical protein